MQVGGPEAIPHYAAEQRKFPAAMAGTLLMGAVAARVALMELEKLGGMAREGLGKAAAAVLAAVLTGPAILAPMAGMVEIIVLLREGDQEG